MTYTTHADLGGRLGHGRVVPEPEDDVFHAEWEGKILALVLAMGAAGRWNIDLGRSARETLPDYLDLSYYEIWYHALVKQLDEVGLAGIDELSAGHALRPPIPVAGVLRADHVVSMLSRVSPYVRTVDALPRFQAGDRVWMRNHSVPHHSRLPGYVWGRDGVIERCHGAHLFPDARAQRLGEQPQFLYTVVFQSTTLWDDARPGDTVSVDAWEPYMEPT